MDRSFKTLQELLDKACLQLNSTPSANRLSPIEELLQPHILNNPIADHESPLNITKKLPYKLLTKSTKDGSLSPQEIIAHSGSSLFWTINSLGTYNKPNYRTLPSGRTQLLTHKLLYWSLHTPLTPLPTLVLVLTLKCLLNDVLKDCLHLPLWIPPPYSTLSNPTETPLDVVFVSFMWQYHHHRAPPPPSTWP